jgi:hypothetical protein
MTRRRLVLGAVVIVAGVVALVVVLLPGKAAAFDSRAWKRPVPAVTSSLSVRADMVDDLIDNHLRPGMSLNRVRALLGPPDEDSGSRWKYWLGWDGDAYRTLIVHNDGLKYQSAEVWAHVDS